MTDISVGASVPTMTIAITGNSMQIDLCVHGERSRFLFAFVDYKWVSVGPMSPSTAIAEYVANHSDAFGAAALALSAQTRTL